MQMIASVYLQPKLLTKPPALHGSFQYFKYLAEYFYFVFFHHLKLAHRRPFNFYVCGLEESGW